MNRLYIIEGLPCSGKSTTSRFVADMLEKQGKHVVFVDEGSGDHPADYEFSAYLTDEELAALPEGEKVQLSAIGEKQENGIVVPLTELSGALFDKALQHKIYDFLPWDKEKPLMLEKWRRFAENADSDTVYVFNCVLLQNPMCETMMRFGFPEERSAEYIREITDIIAPLSPVVIYLRNDDIAQCVEKTSAEREGWLPAVIDYHCGGAYGRSIGAAGLDGYIACLKERQQRELRILQGLPVKGVVLDNAHRDWNGAYEKIGDHICKRENYLKP